MKVLIIEDEKPAADKLEVLIKRYDPEIEIVTHRTSIKDSVAWLQTHVNQIDLMFLDIKLSDGLSFDIFKEVKIEVPIIFTTAFHEYALEAFKVNSIDYLLKPITYDALQQSMKKLKSMKDKFSPNQEADRLQALNDALLSLHDQRKYKSRFMVKVGEHIRSTQVSQIIAFYAEGRYIYIYSDAQRRYIIDYKMEELEELLDPRLFFRANRSYIIHINAIKDVVVYSNSRLKVVPDHPVEKEIIVSRDKVGPFKVWFDGRER
ncbi:MAG: LytR/AlgR family response regulator transcription factor [Cyclobacteriaceae bacterium]